MTTKPVLDQTQDLSGAEQYRLTQLYPPPDYVKSASHAQMHGADDETLPPQVFALPAGRLYRCHTKAATWMSALFFGDKLATLPQSQREQGKQRILKFAADWGILADVAELFQKQAGVASGQTSASPDSDFAFIWVDDTGAKHRHYAIRNSAEVKTAAAWFAKNRDHFVYADRRKIATRILEKAGELEAAIPEAEMLAKTAGYGYSAGTTMAEAWRQRAKLVGSSAPAFAKEAMTMASVLEKSPPGSRDVDVMEKMAILLDQFDRDPNIQLVKYYDKGLERPEETLYQVTEKTAADFMATHVQLTTGNVYTKESLAAIPLDQIRDWMGTGVAAEIQTPSGAVNLEKFAEVLTVLPRPDATMFDRMAESLRIRPAVLDKVGADHGFTPEELNEFRAIYKTAAKAMALPVGAR